MRQAIVFMLVFSLLMLSITGLATADYLLYNGSKTQDIYVAYAYWKQGVSSLGSGYRLMMIQPFGWSVQGWYKVEPGTFENLPVPDQTKEVYLHIERDGQVTLPENLRDKTEFGFMTVSQTVSQNAFSILEVNQKVERLHEGRMEDLVHTRGYYKYPNEGTSVFRGPLKYGVKTFNFRVKGRRILGGGVRDWRKSFSLPGKVLYWRITNAHRHGHGSAKIQGAVGDKHKITAYGRMEDGLVIRGKLDVTLKVYYRK